MAHYALGSRPNADARRAPRWPPLRAASSLPLGPSRKVLRAILGPFAELLGLWGYALEQRLVDGPCVQALYAENRSRVVGVQPVPFVRCMVPSQVLCLQVLGRCTVSPPLYARGRGCPVVFSDARHLGRFLVVRRLLLP